MKKTGFEPDKLALTKQDILDFCDRVLEKWNKKVYPNWTKKWIEASDKSEDNSD